jgi:ABC-2 type transport system ATP-binding protein
MKGEGRTVVLTTHYMDEAEALCDRLAIMDRGKVIATGTPASLISDLAMPSVVELTFEGAAPDPSAFSARLGQAVEPRADLWEIRTPDPKALLPRLLESAEAGAIPFQQVHIRRATLEDVFLQRTGRSLRE